MADLGLEIVQTMNWRVRAIRWLIRSLREEGAFRFRVGHSLVLQNPEPELYMEILFGEQEEVVFEMTYERERWQAIRAGMREVEWRLEREYQPVEEES